VSGRAVLAAIVALTGFAAAACGATQMHVAAIDDMERVRAGVDTQEGGRVAPELFARAEQERRISLDAHTHGDDVAATLHAQRAVAAYEHALVVARLARAQTELADAQKSLADTSAQAQQVEASRAELEKQVQDLEGRLRLARDRLMPAASDKATGDREAARLVAAQSMAAEARLLCDAAQLVASDASGLNDANDAVAKLEDRFAKRPHPAPIDDAARARAECLDVLTRVRRAAGDDAGASDALLSELSSAGGWDPVRDERGVVVTLHDAFQGAALAPDVAKKLADLGRVASAHPGFAVQLVVHDASAPAAKDTTDAKRADAAVQALVAAGAPAARIKSESAGAREPLVDPNDAKARARNERLDVVFVATGTPAAATK
jgi:flagellar motor protein MotB